MSTPNVQPSNVQPIDSAPKPSVGRIVHFQGEFWPVPAVIVSVFNDTVVNLRIWENSPPHNDEFKISVLYDGTEKPEPGTWHWPPRT